MYTLKVIKLGSPNKYGLYSVYIRYYCKVNKKPEVYNHPLNEQLTKEQLALLQKNELKGAINKEYQEQYARLTQVIRALYLLNNGIYPTVQQLKSTIFQITHIEPIEKYVNGFLKTLNAKESSRVQYSSSINRLLKYVELNNKTVQELPTESFFNGFVKSLKSNHVIEKRTAAIIP